MIPFYENTNDDLRAFYSHNLNFPFHLHTQLELLYVLSGSMEITVHHQTAVLKDHDCALIFPNQIHSYQSNHGDNYAITMICDLNLTGNFLNNLTKYHPLIPFIRATELHDDIAYSLDRLITEVQEERSKAVYSAFVQVILSRLFPKSTLEKNVHSESYNLTFEIAQYISQNYTEPLSLDMLATQLCVSKYHLSHVFASKIRTNFNDYLNSFRLNHAIHLIRTTDKSIAEIYNESGFDSQRTFNRVFKKNYGVSPLQFRESPLVFPKQIEIIAK